MPRRKAILWGLTVAVLALLAWKLHASHFDWAGFWHSFQSADWRLLLLATLLIWSNNVCRAVRWTIFLKPSLPPEQRVPWWRLVGAQCIGFAGLAAFGRIGELIRPYLVSKRTGLSFSSQVAVVAVERVFDLGAFAMIFSMNLALSPQLNSLPYHERFHQVGFAIAGLTLVLALFVGAVWVAGAATARLFGSVTGRFSESAGAAVAGKILEFRAGLNTIESFRDFVAVAGLSLLLWMTIALSYVLVMRAFPSPVHDLTVSHSLLLMGFSVVGSLVQLPGIGGGAQAMTIGALTRLFGIPGELAASAGLAVWFVTSITVVLPGLVFARLEQVSIRSVAEASGSAQAGETVH